MDKINFWEEFPSNLQPILFFYFGLLILLICYGLYGDFLGFDRYLDWEVIGQRVALPIPTRDVNIGLFSAPIVADNFLITQWFQGGNIQINTFSSYLFLVSTILGLVLALAASTFLKRAAYIGTTLVFILCITFLKLESLLILGWDDNTWMIIMVVSYLAPSYYLTSVRTHLDFVARFKVFVAITIIWGLVIYFFSEVPEPFLLLSANGFIVPFIIGSFFVVGIGHEIIHLITHLLTRSEAKTGNNFIQFTLFGILYLLNVLFLYLHDTYVIDWKIYYLNPYVLVGLSAIIGIWGMRGRAALMEKDDRLHPAIYFIYLAAGICFFACLQYFISNGNDSILRVVKDVIIYSHLGFGIVFLFYVLGNFRSELQSNEKFSDRIYKPQSIPHFTFRFGGVILIVIGFLYHDAEVPMFQTMSGMFNNLGDYQMATGDRDSGEVYYNNGRIYGYKNHKSNYSLGKISEDRGQYEEAIEYYQDASDLHGSQYAIVNHSNVLLKQNELFRSLFVLGDGRTRFPAGHAILNNTGLLFYKSNIPDSALIYFDASWRAGDLSNTSVTNFLAELARSSFAFNPDSILSSYDAYESIPALSNGQLVSNQKREHLDLAIEIDNISTPMNIYGASYLSNLLVNQGAFFDSSHVRISRMLADDSLNHTYREPIHFSRAIGLFDAGFVDEAIETLRNLTVTTSENWRYHHTLGLLYADLQDYRQAKTYFELAVSEGHAESQYLVDLCELELNEFNRDTLRTRDSGIFTRDSTLAELIIQIVSNQISSFENDLERIIFIYYRQDDLEIQRILSIAEQIEDFSLVSDVLLSICKGFVDKSQYSKALQLIAFLDKNPKKAVEVQWIQEMKQRLAINADSLDESSAILDQDEAAKFPWRLFIELTGQNTLDKDGTDEGWEYLAGINSFDEQVVLEASRYFRDSDNDQKSYDILVHALLQNPYSEELLKAYIFQSTNLGYEGYAKKALGDLTNLMSVQEMTEFREKLDGANSSN